MVTLLELKEEKASLMCKMDDEKKTYGRIKGKTFDRYMEVVMRLRTTEEKLLKPLGKEGGS